MLYPRDILKKIKKVLPRDEFIVLSGARQVGKTSLLLMLKDFLEKKGSACHYFNLENPEHLKLLNKHPFNIFELAPEGKSKQHIFIDEIQYLDDPSKFLKLLYDEKKDKVKIIASGSSSFYIDKKFKDSLAGRKFLFEIYPLNFNELLVFKSQEDLLKRKKKKLSVYHENELKKLWEEYLIYGGYPKVVLAEDGEMKKMMLEEIGSSYIKKDILDAGARNIEKYFHLLKILAGQTGQLVNSQELADTLGTAHKTIEEYLYIMKKSYHIAFISPFYRNIRKELVKMPKVYFFDTGLRNFFLGEYSPISRRSDKGAYAENIVFRELLGKVGSADKIKFWRTQDKKEVDFVSGKEAYEVKFGDRRKVKKSKYAKFKEQYPDIKFSILPHDKILEKFYGWKIKSSSM
ncbi:ATP-binding protein [bacterium]|nr:ATP-binding protein [bacterium]